MFKCLFVLIALFVFLIPVSAQEVEFTCTADEWRTLLGDFQTRIDEVLPTIEGDNDATNILLAIQMVIETARATCGGGVFTKETHPNGIIGPIQFGGTIYQATLEADTFGSLTTTVIEGDCGIIPPIMALTSMEGGSEANLWRFGGDCVAFIEVNVTGSWTLTIERMQ